LIDFSGFTGLRGTTRKWYRKPILAHLYSSTATSDQQQVTPDKIRHFKTIVGSKPTTTRQRLDSWKEIAAFFGRDERTVSRWEKERGLPVHRMPGAKGRVYAFSDELSDWLSASSNAAAAGGLMALGTSEEADAEKPSPKLHVLDGGKASLHVLNPGNPRDPGSKIGLVAAVVILMIVVGLAAMFYRPAVRSGSRTDPAKGVPANTIDAARVGASASSVARDPEAEQLYLKGRYYWNKRTPEDLNKALDYFMQAVVHDPNYSQAYVGLADCYNLLREYSLMSSNEAYTRALAAAKKGVELDDRSSDAHASLAFTLFFGMWDVDKGQREFRRAIELNPDNPAAHHWYANALLAIGHVPEALAEMERAQLLDPSSSSILADKANVFFVAGRRQEALTLLKQLEATEPGFRSPHVYLSYIYLSRKDYPDYLSELRQDALLVHNRAESTIASAAEKGYASGGARGMFEGMLGVEKKLYADGQIPAMSVAASCARLGNRGETLRYLTAAYDHHETSMLFVNIYPEYDNLHADPAYRDLIAHLKLPVIN
jgi:tetratricopeptide (TPR) repeat protein